METKYIQLRLAKSDYERLSAEADAAGRTIPAEILHRAGITGQYTHQRAIGDLAVIVAQRADEGLIRYAIGPKGHKSEFLGLVRDAFDFLLTNLGAEEVAIEEGGVSIDKGIVWDLVSAVKRPDERLPIHPQAAELARIGRALGFGTSEPTKGSNATSKGGNRK